MCFAFVLHLVEAFKVEDDVIIFFFVDIYYMLIAVTSYWLLSHICTYHDTYCSFYNNTNNNNHYYLLMYLCRYGVIYIDVAVLLPPTLVLSYNIRQILPKYYKHEY
jgi:hypothetical protein